MYFDSALWWKVFTKKQARLIKVYICGSLDFSPIQHAVDLNWVDGAVCLIESGVVSDQGSGLPVLPIDLFMEAYRAGAFTNNE